LIPVFFVFVLVTFGLGWPVAARLNLDPAERLGAAAGLSLVLTYLAAWAVYLLAWPPVTLLALPVIAAGALVLERRRLAETLADSTARAILVAWALVTAWCIGWLATIASYSGGGWAGDWFEHWERARFFLERWPVDAKFLGFGPLPARPPLANLVEGALGGAVDSSFAAYQVAMALMNCLVVVPAALLARRFSPKAPAAGPAAVAVLAVLLMLNPSFVQNATFAWTKLITAFFVLSGLYFFLRAHDGDAPPAAGPLCAVSLAAGILAHYSAGPYVLLLAAGWLVMGRGRNRAWWRQTALLGLLGGALLATWFGWSATVYGVRATLLSNSSVAVPEAHQGNQLVKIALNLRDTLVPHFLRTVDGTLIAQRSPWGHARDWLFQLYQVNLFLVFGSVAWLVLARELLGRAGEVARPVATRWTAFVGGAVVLGIAVHGARDTWGLAHICLQSLVVLGLAFLAARWSGLGRGWRWALGLGAAVDFVGGIALHFGVQSYAFDHWFAADRPAIDLLKSYSDSAFMNLAGKVAHRLQFLADTTPLSGALVLALLAVILAVAVGRAARPGPRAD